MGIEVFNRYEKKYIITNESYESLKHKLQTYLDEDAYNKKNGFYTICNIYYDTINDELIKKSLSKPMYKEKLRLRAYGIPGRESKGYLEIKKKYKGIVNKRRCLMTLDEAYEFMVVKQLENVKSYHNQQVLKELEFFVKRYKLEPAVYIAYDRKALLKDDLRITFDTNIRTRRYDLALELGDYGEPLISEGTWLMEIKASGAYPIWLTQILSEMALYPSSFSKYGSEFANYHLQHLHEGDNLC